MSDATVHLINTSPSRDNIHERRVQLLKIKEFQMAMDKYHASLFYKKIGILIAILIIGLQLTTALQFYQGAYQIEPFNLIITFLCAYFLTDFINGLVHLFMDNNTHYTSFLGPLIAAFHLHHVTPRYADKHPLKVYFYESGSKHWLVFYLALLAVIQHIDALPLELNFGLVCIGILSSVAEVSHYWCHNSNSNRGFIKRLQHHGVLLSKKHHRIHHTVDNKNYAFLNGLSDPLINLIANYVYDGYKSDSDLHAKAYQGPQTDNRH